MNRLSREELKQVSRLIILYGLVENGHERQRNARRAAIQKALGLEKRPMHRRDKGYFEFHRAEDEACEAEQYWKRRMLYKLEGILKRLGWEYVGAGVDRTVWGNGRRKLVLKLARGRALANRTEWLWYYNLPPEMAKRFAEPYQITRKGRILVSELVDTSFRKPDSITAADAVSALHNLHVSDLHEGNVGLRITDKKPVVLDSGHQIYKAESWYLATVNGDANMRDLKRELAHHERERDYFLSEIGENKNPSKHFQKSLKYHDKQIKYYSDKLKDAEVKLKKLAQLLPPIEKSLARVVGYARSFAK